MGVTIIGNMMQNYNFDLFLAKLTPEMVPLWPPGSYYINLITTQMVLKSLNLTFEVH